MTEETFALASGHQASDCREARDSVEEPKKAERNASVDGAAAFE